jgi:hypothetical protein
VDGRTGTDEGENIQVRNEIAVLKRVSMGHQNILTLVDYFETMNNRICPCVRGGAGAGEEAAG